MRQVKNYIALAFALLMGSSLFAQIATPVDFMRNNPRAVFANPATYTADYGYFDMGLGGINIGAMKMGLKYDKFFQFNEQGQPVVLDLNKGIASLRNKNYVNTFVNVDIFHCGRRTNHGFFTYTHRLRERESFRFNKDMMELMAHGNAAFLGESNPANIEMGVAAKVFQEFDFGYQMSLTEQLNVGLRLKFLMGYADSKSQTLNVKLFTDPETYALRMMGNVGIRASLPYEFYMEDDKIKIKDRRFNPAALFKNYGFGIDLGGEYQIDEQWGVAAAINDLGFIRWKDHALSFEGNLQDGGMLYEDGSVVFSGLTPQQVSAMIQDPNYFDGITDTLIQYVRYDLANLTGYTSGLNMNLMARGYYDLTPEHRFTAQLMGCNFGLGMKPALTLAYTGSFSGKYDVVATYTMMPGSYDNLGIGLSANLGGALIYVATNSIFGLFNPANRTQTHAQFGLSFTSGEKIPRSETIILRDKAAEAAAEMEE